MTVQQNAGALLATTSPSESSVLHLLFNQCYPLLFFCTSGLLFPVQLAEMYYMPRLRLVGATVTGMAVKSVAMQHSMAVWQVKSVAVW